MHIYKCTVKALLDQCLSGAHASLEERGVCRPRPGLGHAVRRHLTGRERDDGNGLGAHQ
jgi:hypothetical protein